MKENAQKFFDDLEKDEKLRAQIRLGLESLTKIASGYDVTEEELEVELRKRWDCKTAGGPHYSEPPRF